MSSTTLTPAGAVRQGAAPKSTMLGRIAQWLDAAPHPPVACEIAPAYVAAARWGHAGNSVDAFAMEPLSSAAINPNAVDANLNDAAEVRAAVEKVFGQIHAKGHPAALLVPDPVVRVFVLHFDEFPRSTSEALPLLRWRLKKSVPFETDETLISFMKQPSREPGIDVVTALARQRVIREYEQLVEAAGLIPGVVMSSTLAAIPLLDDTRPALLARVAGKTLTTAIVREGLLCGYRCTEIHVDHAAISPQALLDEIYPLAAYYRDSWREGIGAVYLAGLGERVDYFRGPLQQELGCAVSALLGPALQAGHGPGGLQPLLERDLDALAGWALNRGA